MRIIAVPIAAIAYTHAMWETWRGQRAQAARAHADALQAEAIARCRNTRNTRDSWHDDDEPEYCRWDCY